MDKAIDDMVRTEKVQACQNIAELTALFDEFKVVVGSHKEYDAEKLKYKVQQLRFWVSNMEFDKIPWNVITRTHGIRAKCMELFWYEKNGI